MNRSERSAQKSKARRAARVAKRSRPSRVAVAPRAAGPLVALTAKYPVSVGQALEAVDPQDRERFLTNALAVWPA